MFDLILQTPLSSLVGSESKVAGGRRGRPSLSWMFYVDLNFFEYECKKTNRKSFGQKRIGLCHEESKGKSERIVVLKNKNKRNKIDVHNKQLFVPCKSINRMIIIMETVSFLWGRN